MKNIENYNRVPSEQTNPAVKWNEGFDIWNANNIPIRFPNFIKTFTKNFKPDIIAPIYISWYTTMTQLH